jgi:hypothetical protein
MTSDSAERPTPEHDAAPAASTTREGGPAQVHGPAGAQPAEQREEFGALELLRTRKADGRALLLFSHRREQGQR